MRYAEVSVNSPIAQRRTFSYHIPPGLDITAGQAVFVPFGSRILQGVVMELVPSPAVAETKEISGPIETAPVLSPARIALARWISDYYLSPLFDAVALFLPPGFERKAITFVSLPELPDDYDFSSLSTEQQSAVAMVRAKKRLSIRELEKVYGQRKAQSLVSQLVGRGIALRSYELERIKVRPKTVAYISLAVPAEQAQEEASRLEKGRAVKQAALLRFLLPQSGPVLFSDVLAEAGGNRSAVNALIRRGLIGIEQVPVKREPLSYLEPAISLPLSLTSAQQAALDAIKSSPNREKINTGSADVFLLHGVTGSGKTEVYLQALAEAVRLGKRGIVLVPEIALTPQTIERFDARFPRRVAVLHSGLSLGEQYDEWQAIKNGDFDVVIGPRSALFTPQPDLGLIVIDEEHEWTYKQEDKSPRYHARDAAIKLAELSGATVVLGSATPDVVSYYRAETGQYRLLELPERVTPEEGAPLPRVDVVDMREELKEGNIEIFSRSLSQAVSKAVASREQVILFLNRRGTASFVQCRSCGFVLACRRCDVPLAYHFAGDVLICHQCNYHMKTPAVCPRCRSRKIKYLGTGTQKLVEEAGRTFPQAGLLRWDSDVTGRSMARHQEILSKFRSHRADILVGTQMVAKGLDLPLVTVVGVVNADIALHLPDFRAGEKTFQLLSQVAGRAGRGILGGRVIIQTYSPEHYAIQAASKHDYLSFYNQEMAYRRQLRYPPLVQLACLLYTHTNDSVCQKEAERMKRLLLARRDEKGIADLSLIGPAPAFVHRLRGKFRWQIIVRGTALAAFLAEIPLPRGWTLDIDPVSLI